MYFSERITAQADPKSCWSALTAVTTWPQWTPSMREVRPLGSGQIAVGQRFRVSQPGLPTVVWEVSEVQENESFTWTNDSAGVHTVAYHRLTPLPGGGTEISIGIHQTGALSGLIGALTKSKTLRYLKLEAAGLKAASETHAG